MADGFFTCGVNPLGVAPQLFGQVALVNARVDDTLNATLQLASELAAYPVANLSFSVNPATPQQYTIQTAGDLPDFEDITLGDLAAPPSIGAASISPLPNPEDAPLPPSQAPEPNIPVAPNAYNPLFDPAYSPVFGPLPTYGDLTSGIPFPTLFPITLPTPPDVDFNIPFTGTKPIFTGTPPDPADFDYVDPGYTAQLSDEIKATLRSMFAGESGLPRVVEEALWAREADREQETANAAIQDAYAESASRGFTLPNGILMSRLMQVKQNNQNKKNSLGRDVMIRVHEVLIDQLKFAVTSGLQYEDQYMRLYNEIQNRRLQSAQVAINIAIQVFNALVSQYQAQAQVYGIEAEVYKTQIEAELAKLQAYSEEIKAQQLIGQLNEQEVAIYTARLEAVKTNVQVYLAQIQAYSEAANVEKIKLEAMHEKIEIEQTKLQASKLQLDIWSGKIQGQALIQDAYKTRTDAYMAFVQAWSAKYNVEIERQRGAIAVEEANTSRYLGQIQGVVAQANYLVAKAQALVAANSNKVQAYSAQVTGVASYNEALSQKIRMVNDINTQNLQIALKNGEINAQNGLAVIQLQENALATATQVLAQITSSFASSVNLNGSASDSTAFGQSCSYSTSQSFD